jgi:hypothetical protein
MPLFGTIVDLNSAAKSAGTAVADNTYIAGSWKTYLTLADFQATASSAVDRFQEGQIVYISSSNELYKISVVFNTSSFANEVISQSFSWPGSGGGSTDTGSLLTTASLSNNVFTFTKGDASTFDIDISPVTSSLITTASVSSNTITFTKGDSTTFNITVDTGSGGGGDAFPYTGSAEVTGSFGVTGSVGVNIEDGNGGDTKFAVNSQGAIVLAALVTPPTPITGGVYYSSSGDFFVGTN